MLMPTLDAGSRAAVTSVNEPLMGPRSQRLELGLIGARTAAVLRQICDGATLDEYDKSTIGDALETLRTLAEGIDFVSSRGKKGKRLGSYSFAAVALTLKATSSRRPPSSNDATKDHAEALRALANDLESVRASTDIKKAARILPQFSTLAKIATSSAGSSGDTTRTL